MNAPAHNEMKYLRYTDIAPLDFGKNTRELPTLRAGVLYKMFSAMKEVNRPTDDVAWRYYESARKIAWKTGTSFGNKDAWAIGATPEYVVAVWVGNATGEGRLRTICLFNNQKLVSKYKISQTRPATRRSR